ncbi:MAG: hypothetical protein JNM96_01475 [Bacteroidia bacterium]|nr:hypothetical protein [Bacteroidia bacterium]
MQGNEDIKFPLYRKYKNNKRFYKIISKREFVEIQQIGQKLIQNTIIANQFPEMMFISDLINNYSEFAEAMPEEEFTMLCSKISNP